MIYISAGAGIYIAITLESGESPTLIEIIGNLFLCLIFWPIFIYFDIVTSEPTKTEKD